MIKKREDTLTDKPDIALSHTRWNAIYESDDLAPTSPIHDKTIASYVDFLKPYIPRMKRGVLDLGCGIAWTGLELAKQGVPITGVDISEEAIEKSKRLFQKEKKKGRFIRASLADLPFDDDEFPFIYSCMSLEYVKDTKRALRESYRVVQKEGTMIAIVPVVSLTTLTYHQLRGDIPSIPILGKIMEFIHITVFNGKFMKYGYEKSFTTGQLRKLFTSAGLTVVTIDFFPMYYPVTFLPRPFRALFRSLLKRRIFWPLVYVEAVK